VAYRYDEMGNLAEVINSSGQALRYSYDDQGRLTGWDDRNGFSYRYYYDEQGRCVQADCPGGALSGTLVYDPDNLVTTHTNTAGAVTVYQFTPRGRAAAISDPLGNTTRNEHDSYGRLVARTDPLGRTTRWAYDQRPNLTAVIRPDGSQATAVFPARAWHRPPEASPTLYQAMGVLRARPGETLALQRMLLGEVVKYRLNFGYRCCQC
jgi:YD repeat-containing protein